MLRDINSAVFLIQKIFHDNESEIQINLRAVLTEYCEAGPNIGKLISKNDYIVITIFILRM